MLQGPSESINTGEKLKFRSGIQITGKSFPQGPKVVPRSIIEFLLKTIDSFHRFLLFDFSKQFLIGVELQFAGIHLESERNRLLGLSGGD